MTASEASSKYRLRLPTRATTTVIARRLAQGLVDLALSSGLVALVLALYLLVPLEAEFASETLFVVFSVLILALALWVHAWYWVARPSRHGRGQTTGMELLEIRVVDAGGGPATVGQLFVRWLLLPVDLLLVGLVLMLRDVRHRRLGDLVAGTAVVRD
ncbi:RDD family protein [Nocardiopsis ansamitocini]|uniref:RDD family protein n=1 Tax=Nocardiopsis ansamitocini TaxID=1670832 RepID=UPI0025557B49|nr:RDD family protein [Nocardiopsis ansamitocini]